MLAFSGRPTALIPRDGMGQAKPSSPGSWCGDGEGGQSLGSWLSLGGQLRLGKMKVAVFRGWEWVLCSNPSRWLALVGVPHPWVWHRLCLMHGLPVGWEAVGTPNLVCGSHVTPGRVWNPVVLRNLSLTGHIWVCSRPPSQLVLE